MDMQHFKMILIIASIIAFLGSNPLSATEDHDNDPWEPVNRAVFSFNDFLDALIVRPAAKSYRYVAPQFVEVGVENFFDNISGVPTVFNDLLQAKWSQAGHDSARFLLNTLAGLAGFVDVADKVGLEKNQREDFGQTLRRWGLPEGPYLVVPFLGPSTLTDFSATPVNWWTYPRTYIADENTRYWVTGLDYTSIRAKLLAADGLIGGDKYVFYREAYLQNREFLVNDGEVTDDFGGELDDFEDF
jgi:phospholipid-binding lipoprotein MlaA